MTLINGQTAGITMVYCRLPGQLLISVAVTVKVNVPAALGVPEIIPVAGLRISPLGKLPLEIAKV